MTKIKCNVCSNENNSFCTIKKVKVHINKKRNCDFYVYDSSKLKVKQKIPSIRVGYIEQQNDRRKSKEKLKELKKLVEANPGKNIAHDLGMSNSNGHCTITTVPNDLTAKHPLTGDLSRFTTTATKED